MEISSRPAPSRRRAGWPRRALLTVAAPLIALAAWPAEAQLKRDYDVGLSELARAIAEGLSLQARSEDGQLKASLIRQARSARDLVCEPFSSKLAGRVNDELTGYLAGFRLDRIDSQRLETRDDSVAIAVKWSVEDDETVMLKAEATRFSDLKILTSATSYVRAETIPASDRICLSSQPLFAQCRADTPVTLFDSPAPERAKVLGQIAADQPFQVLGAFNMQGAEALALLVSYQTGSALETSQIEQRRAFALGGTTQLKRWAESGVCTVSVWGGFEPERARRSIPWRPYARVPESCRDCPPMMVLPEMTLATSSYGASSTGPESLVGAGVQFEVSGLIAMAETEVTVEQWQACVRGGGCADLRETATGNRPYNAPVSVSYRQALDYVAWLNTQSDGTLYRLPTEAEWEFAARGEAGYAGRGVEPPRYWWGDVMREAFAVCRGCAPGTSAIDGPEVVGLSRDRTSRWGLSDLAGNLWEWVDACWQAGTEPRPARVCASGERVVKGGSYLDGPLALAVGNRAVAPEGMAHPAIGFRVVASSASAP